MPAIQLIERRHTHTPRRRRRRHIKTMSWFIFESAAPGLPLPTTDDIVSFGFQFIIPSGLPNGGSIPGWSCGGRTRVRSCRGALDRRPFPRVSRYGFSLRASLSCSQTHPLTSRLLPPNSTSSTASRYCATDSLLLFLEVLDLEILLVEPPPSEHQSFVPPLARQALALLVDIEKSSSSSKTRIDSHQLPTCILRRKMTCRWAHRTVLSATRDAAVTARVVRVVRQRNPRSFLKIAKDNEQVQCRTADARHTPQHSNAPLRDAIARLACRATCVATCAPICRRETRRPARAKTTKRAMHSSRLVFHRHRRSPTSHA
jgi:hypothetical protein